MNKFKIIVGEVYKRNLKSFSFWSMVLSPFLMIGLIAIIGYFAAGGFDDTQKIGVITTETPVVEMMKTAFKDENEIKTYESEEKAKKALEKEKIDAFVVVAKKDADITGKLVVTEGLGQGFETTLSALLTQYQQQLKIATLKLTPEQAAEIQQPAKFTQEKLKVEDGKLVEDDRNQVVQYAVSFILVIMIFFVIISYSSIIAQEIASEKGTRIMEVLLSSTTAEKHFYGKLVGILCVALTQFGIYLVGFGVAWPFITKQAFVKELLQGLDLNEVFNRLFLYNLLFFFVGVIGYSVLAALCGSLVNKTEDVPKAIIPVTYIGLLGYLIGITIGTNNPQSIVVKVASYIPFLSSFTMPVRLASDTVSTTGIFVSLGILIATTILLTFFSAKMYKSNVLVYSEGGIFKTLKQSFALMKSEK